MKPDLNSSKQSNIETIYTGEGDPSTFWLKILERTIRQLNNTCNFDNKIRQQKQNLKYNTSPFWHAPASLVHINEINKTKFKSSDQWQLFLPVHETHILYIGLFYWKRSTCSFLVVRHEVGTCAVCRLNEYARDGGCSPTV